MAFNDIEIEGCKKLLEEIVKEKYEPIIERMQKQLDEASKTQAKLRDEIHQHQKLVASKPPCERCQKADNQHNTVKNQQTEPKDRINGSSDVGKETKVEKMDIDTKPEPPSSKNETQSQPPTQKIQTCDPRFSEPKAKAPKLATGPTPLKINGLSTVKLSFERTVISKPGPSSIFRPPGEPEVIEISDDD